MDRWIWKVRNSFNWEEAVKTPLKEQWIFFYGKKDIEKKGAKKEEENREE